jgi:hypothetical protein
MIDVSISPMGCLSYVKGLDGRYSLEGARIALICIATSMVEHRTTILAAGLKAQIDAAATVADFQALASAAEGWTGSERNDFTVIHDNEYLRIHGPELTVRCVGPSAAKDAHKIKTEWERLIAPHREDCEAHLRDAFLQALG